MKNYIVLGNPIGHSWSPKIHNYWIKENKIEANYTKEEVLENQLEEIVNKIKKKQINGANITVPFKEKIIPFVDMLSPEAEETKSVNTLYLSENKVIGHNTDIAGFYFSLKENNLDFKDKSALILGSGGVTPSIIMALKKLGIKKITISNRTKDKALKLKDRYKFLEIIEWEETIKANLIINATSLGLNDTDIINLDLEQIEKDSFFYDVIYNPKRTNFLKKAFRKGFSIQNGLMMLIYQAAEAFKVWHKIVPQIDKNLIEFLDND